MEWSPQFPNLNCIENLLEIVKQKLYEVEKQYNNKEYLKQQTMNVIYEKIYKSIDCQRSSYKDVNRKTVGQIRFM